MSKELFNNPYYFFLNKKDGEYVLHFSVSDNIVEARKKEEKIKIPKDKISNLKKYVKGLKDKKKNSKQIKKEIEELVDSDGSFSNSSVPILDPAVMAKKTMDQTVAMGRITNDPVTRGYRTYYGESVDETDMSKAFGYEETKDMDGEETYKYLKTKMGMSDDEAKNRTKEFGKDPTGEKDKKSKYNKNKKFVMKGTLSEINKENIYKVLEDILVSKNSSQPSKILLRNIESLKKQAERDGLSVSDLIKLFK